MNGILRKRRDQTGVALIIVAGLIVMFVAFVALSVDIAHLYVVRNELQNAADSGALAGARRLYFPDGSGINTVANQVAYEAAIANNSEKVAVEVNSPNTNADDVQRGHWSFATQTFAPSPNIAPPVLWNRTSAELDADPSFVNAVMVRTRRQQTQAASFFARILGHAGFDAGAEAVAYIGFAGRLAPGEADQPIAVCKQSIQLGESVFQCNTGRMLNSGSDASRHNTAAWTNFSQDNVDMGTSCHTANDRELKDLICSSGNPMELLFGDPMGVNGGVMEAIKNLRDCFDPVHRTEPWPMTLPVIDCQGNNPNSCHVPVVGTVEVEIVWISDKDADTEKKFKAEDFPPASMGDWVCDEDACGDEDSNPTWRACCWDDFVDHFNLKDVNDNTAFYAKKSIYFKPVCEPQFPTGGSGGQNFGILAKRPVLVD